MQSFNTGPSYSSRRGTNPSDVPPRVERRSPAHIKQPDSTINCRRAPRISGTLISLNDPWLYAREFTAPELFAPSLKKCYKVPVYVPTPSRMGTSCTSWDEKLYQLQACAAHQRLTDPVFCNLEPRIYTAGFHGFPEKQKNNAQEQCPAPESNGGLLHIYLQVRL
ncbi:hypothetical protein B0H17DRAFT_1142316 [Mycena rosella]|uniref:Uncharacterized protein n=1 Tax=Mycena rosella TaxID=1033263 RepID=A0AAD7G5N8_MYCRO|nr:hypothetical protein B0H17DRAFT_1142316 [Mycena rosella]